MTVFNGTREIQIISLLWEVNSNKKDTNVCHETVIIFQCIQIRKLELILKHMHKSEVKFCQLQHQTMNEFETLTKL